MPGTTIPAQTLKRLPSYYKFLKTLSPGTAYISATGIARDLCLNDVQVRKDLAAVSDSGRPKIGYPVEALLGDIEQVLGNHSEESAVLIGVGNLGRAVLSYEGFANHGINIVAAFDDDPKVAGKSFFGRQVLSTDKLGTICARMKITIGIIAVPGNAAQRICNRLTVNGVCSILNLTPVTLTVPSNVTVVNADIDASLAALISGLRRNSCT